MRMSGSRLSRMSKMMTSQADTELSMLAKTRYKRCCLRKGLCHREHLDISNSKSNRSATETDRLLILTKLFHPRRS